MTFRRSFIAAICLGLLFVSTSRAEIVTLEVTVKSLNVETNTVVVTKSSATKSKDIELEVGKTAKVTVGGKPGTLADVKAGQKATIAYESALEVVTKIDVASNSPAAKPKSTADELKALQGTWVAVGEETDGKPMRKEDVAKMRKTLTIKDEGFSLIWSGKSMQGKCKLIPSEDASQPAGIDLNGPLPTGKQAVLRGIYELQGDTLRVSYVTYVVNGEEFDRPTTFATKAGKKGISVTYERQK